jgi:hypothetical protein
VYYSVTQARLCNCCYIRKVVSITYGECVFVALGTLREMWMHHTVISVLSGSTVFFHIISQTALFSKKRYWIQNVYIDFLYNFCEKYFSFYEELRRYDQKIYICLHVKYPVILVIFKWNLNFFQYNRKNIPISNFMKIRPVGAELFHADRRTGMTKLIVAFPVLQTHLKTDIVYFLVAKCKHTYRYKHHY